MNNIYNNPWSLGLVPISYTIHEGLVTIKVYGCEHLPIVMNLNDIATEAQLRQQAKEITQQISTLVQQHQNKVPVFNRYQIHPTEHTFRLEVSNHWNPDYNDLETQYGYTKNEQITMYFTLPIRLLQSIQTDICILEKDRRTHWILDYDNKDEGTMPYLQCYVLNIDKSYYDRDILNKIQFKNRIQFNNLTDENIELIKKENNKITGRPRDPKNAHLNRGVYTRIIPSKRNPNRCSIQLIGTYKDCKGKRKRSTISIPSSSDPFEEEDKIQEFQDTFQESVVETKGARDIHLELRLNPPKQYKTAQQLQDYEYFKHNGVYKNNNNENDEIKDKITAYGTYPVNRPTLKCLEYSWIWSEEVFVGRMLNILTEKKKKKQQKVEAEEEQMEEQNDS